MPDIIVGENHGERKSNFSTIEIFKEALVKGLNVYRLSEEAKELFEEEEQFVLCDVEMEEEPSYFEIEEKSADKVVIRELFYDSAQLRFYYSYFLVLSEFTTFLERITEFNEYLKKKSEDTIILRQVAEQKMAKNLIRYGRLIYDMALTGLSAYSNCDDETKEKIEEYYNSEVSKVKKVEEPLDDYELNSYNKEYRNILHSFIVKDESTKNWDTANKTRDGGKTPNKRSEYVLVLAILLNWMSLKLEHLCTGELELVNMIEKNQSEKEQKEEKKEEERNKTNPELIIQRQRELVEKDERPHYWRETDEYEIKKEMLNKWCQEASVLLVAMKNEAIMLCRVFTLYAHSMETKEIKNAMTKENKFAACKLMSIGVKPILENKHKRNRIFEEQGDDAVQTYKRIAGVISTYRSIRMYDSIINQAHVIDKVRHHVWVIGQNHIRDILDAYDDGIFIKNEEKVLVLEEDWLEKNVMKRRDDED